MFERLRRDLQRYWVFESRDGNPRLFEKMKIVVESHGLKGVALYRFGSWINRSVKSKPLKVPLKLAYLALDEAMGMIWGMRIHCGANIAGGLLIPHADGVLIGPVTMGEDCMVSHYVTIGVRPGVVREAPAIGDRVFIGPGSVLFGNIVVASGASVGPLTCVGRNVPPNTLVAGSPMVVVNRNHDNHEIIYGGRPLQPSSPSPTPSPLGRNGS